MKAFVFSVCAGVLCTFSAIGADGDKLRIIAFGAHPDDCEIQTGGTAAMWAAREIDTILKELQSSCAPSK